MTIEQTEQLIQLILNSLLLVAICVIVLSSLVMRHASIMQRCQRVQQEYVKLLTAGESSGEVGVSAGSDRLKLLKHQLRLLRQHYRLTHASVLMTHYALLFCIASTLVLALRAFIYVNWLIHLALVLFVIGVVMLMISISLSLFDWYGANHSVWAELNWGLNLGEAELGRMFPSLRRRSSRHQPAKSSRRRAVSS